MGKPISCTFWAWRSKDLWQKIKMRQMKQLLTVAHHKGRLCIMQILCLLFLDQAKNKSLLKQQVETQTQFAKA